MQLKYAITVAGQHSLNDAAKMLFISQPSLSAAIRFLEKEIGFDIFIRPKNGITVTAKGAEFIGYAKSVMEQYELLDAKYISHTEAKKTFSVSMQRYTFAEEVLSTYQYKRFIRANDRATLLNLMVGLNGFTLCSGIICEELYGEEYCAVKLKSEEKMTIRYISRKDAPISPFGQKYLEEIAKFKEKTLE
ncbi:MAG: LysR family transcriptional regulator [Roseburia sp.]|nr:LysR family transcriptional regulator [Roseburia sp.]